MSGIKSDIKAIIKSSIDGRTFEIDRFTEFNVDLDLDMDADQFIMTFGNPDGMYTGVINKLDKIQLEINGEGIFSGSIDECEYSWDSSSNEIKIVGRDISSSLIDNDALPGTKYNIDIKKYMAEKCSEYGIPKYRALGADICKKLIIGSSETELSVMYNIITESNMKIWTEFDTLVQGNWDTKADPVYKFARGKNDAIPIKSLKLRDSAANMRSEYRLYGSMSDGTEKVVGVAKNDFLVSKGIKKRKTMRTSNNDSASKYASSALRHIQEDFQNDILLTITVPLVKAILPNRVAHIYDEITGLDATFFIKNVTYNKDSNGSNITIKMIPDQKTFNVIWSTSRVTTGSTTTSGKSLSQLLGGK